MYRCVTIMLGLQCVVITGTLLMLMSFVENLVFRIMVGTHIIIVWKFIFNFVVGSSYYTSNHFQVSANPSFVYGTFSCLGNEQSLKKCPRNSLSSLLTCSSDDIAGVQCEGIT